MAERTIHFSNAHEAADVTGSSSEILDNVQDTLGVQVVSRDTWVRVEGEEDKVELADRFFQCLRKARARGAYSPGQSIDFTLRAFRDGRERDVEALLEAGIPVGKGKPRVFPRTFGQQAYIQCMKTHDMVLGLGPAGTGKTYLAMAMAVSQLLEHQVNRIILTRPAIEAGEALGFLPGDMYQKVLPYLRPLYDALYDMMDAESIQRMIDQGVIEVAPLAYMRGRTLNNAFVILDEAQNTTPEQMLMFLTRLGFESKCIVTGDLTQIDLPNHRQSGLQEATRALAGIPGIGTITLGDADVVRHQLVQQIIQAYRRHRGTETGPSA